jgi:hypothetical protein
MFRSYDHGLRPLFEKYNRKVVEYLQLTSIAWPSKNQDVQIESGERFQRDVEHAVND